MNACFGAELAMRCRDFGTFYFKRLFCKRMMSHTCSFTVTDKSTLMSLSGVDVGHFLCLQSIEWVPTRKLTLARGTTIVESQCLAQRRADITKLSIITQGCMVYNLPDGCWFELLWFHSFVSTERQVENYHFWPYCKAHEMIDIGRAAISWQALYIVE